MTRRFLYLLMPLKNKSYFFDDAGRHIRFLAFLFDSLEHICKSMATNNP